MSKSLDLRRALAACALVSLVAAGCGQPTTGQAAAPTTAANAAASTLKKVTLGISTVTDDPSESYYTGIPLALGLWKKEGLSVKLVNFPGGNQTAAALVAGRINFGVLGNESLLQADSKGAHIRSYYTSTTKNEFLPTVPVSSKIHSIGQLAGATIGVPGLAATTIPMIKAMLASVGKSQNSAHFLVTGAGVTALDAYRAHRIQAFGLFDGAAAGIKTLGSPVRYVTNSYWTNLGFSEGVAASASYLRSHSKIAVELARGIAEATVFARADPVAAVSAFYHAIPSAKPIGVSNKKALAIGKTILDARLPHAVPIDGRYGYAPASQISDFMSVFVKTGVVPKALPLATFWTTRYLARIDHFNQNAVHRQAVKYCNVQACL